MKLFYASLIVITFTGCPRCSPTSPTAEEEDIQWECEKMLTHPIRQTYALRCVHPITGEVQIREDN
jgi:hypothetical protein